MKKSITILTVLLFSSILSMECFSQSFYTGGIGVTLSNFGRVRVFSDNLTTRQVDRSSVLVGVSSTSVFDYTQDAGTVVAATTVAVPTLSDFEVTGTINNSDSNLPPAVEVKTNIYGWTNGAYLLVKMNVKNNEISAISSVIGIEIIDQIDGTYGTETVQYNAASQTVFINRTSWVGYKFFSAPQTSLKSFEWVSGYANDASFYQWLTQGTFDPAYTAGVDGAVAIMGQNPININPGQSTDFYLGISLGADQTTCSSNMNLCLAKYNQVVPVELTSFTGIVQNRQVSLNWSTATEINNNGFEVQRSTSNSEFLTVGFVRGAGTTTTQQEYSFTDKNIIDGIYTYRLKQIDFNGEFEYSNAIEVDVRSLDNYSLEQNYPNPFNPSTKIAYILKEKTNVKLLVMNALGEEVAVLVNQTQEQGYHQLDFNASNLPSGIYFYSLQTENYSETKKMLLMK